jgi:hypothetical protein
VQKGYPPVPPAARSSARGRAQCKQRKPRISLWTLLLTGVTLLLAAYYFGKKTSDSAEQQALTASSAPRSADAANSRERTRATVIQGEKATKPRHLADASMSVSPDGEVLHINGTVGRNFAADLQRQLEHNPFLQSKRRN